MSCTLCSGQLKKYKRQEDTTLKFKGWREMWKHKIKITTDIDLTSTQIFFDRQCGPPKSTQYIFGQFMDNNMDVDQGEKHLIVYMLADIKVNCASWFNCLLLVSFSNSKQLYNWNFHKDVALVNPRTRWSHLKIEPIFLQELSHYMVTDMVSILASVGGALGLCLGFSLWGAFNTGFKHRFQHRFWQRFQHRF